MIAQANIGFNRYKGTLRGMHFQFPPAAETKLVRCTRGAILDIIVDLRPESPTFLEHIAVELSADNHRALYVPERFAHGYQVLEDDTETSYQVGEFYTPAPRAACRRRSRPRPELAAPGHRDLRQGRGLGAALGGPRRHQGPDGGRRPERRRAALMILVDTALRAREERAGRSSVG